MESGGQGLLFPVSFRPGRHDDSHAHGATAQSGYRRRRQGWSCDRHPQERVRRGRYWWGWAKQGWHAGPGHPALRHFDEAL